MRSICIDNRRVYERRFTLGKVYSLQPIERPYRLTSPHLFCSVVNDNGGLSEPYRKRFRPVVEVLID